jgi:hypothetical protein
MLKTSVYALAVRGILGGSVWENLFHYIPNQTFDVEDVADLELLDLTQVFRNAIWRPGCAALMSESLIVKDFYCVEIKSSYLWTAHPVGEPDKVKIQYGEELLTAGASADNGQVTLATSDCLPSNVALTVAFRGRLREKRSRGSKRFCGLPENQTDVNRFKAGYVASWQGVANAMATDTVEDGGVPNHAFWPVIFSYKYATRVVVPAADLIPLATRRITEAVVRPVISTQKSRQERN